MADKVDIRNPNMHISMSEDITSDEKAVTTHSAVVCSIGLKRMVKVDIFNELI